VYATLADGVGKINKSVESSILIDVTHGCTCYVRNLVYLDYGLNHFDRTDEYDIDI